MPAVAIIYPSGGPIPATSFTTPPWELWGFVIPGFGSPPTSAQFEVEVLQPPNVDGSRIRAGGAHFPEFTINGIIPAKDFPTAGAVAREIERTKAGRMVFKYTRDGASAYEFYVKDARAFANAGRILGATSSSGAPSGDSAGPAPSAEALASVDISLVLQYFAA
jgi:hypothetical protein